MKRLQSILLLCAALTSCSPTPDRSHIVLVTVDTLRADHLSLNGYERETSPRVDAFAKEALHFPQAIVVLPKTGPAMTTHLSGLEPCEHQVTANPIRIPNKVPLIAQLLKDADYRTAAFVSNPVLSREKGYARGFDIYREFSKEGGLDELNASFMEWAEGDDWDTPTFVWIHYIDPHGPYTPPAQYADLFTSDALFRGETRTLPTTYARLRGWPINYCLGAIPHYQLLADEGRVENRVAAYVARYDAEIRYMDDRFGDVIDFLRAQDVYDDSTIVFTADHGESMGEHDYWFEHGWYAYEATLRVPMIVKPHGAPSAGRTIDTQVTNLDTVPTILSAAGLPIPGDLPGHNMLGELPDAPRFIMNTAAYPQLFHGVRTPQLKYLREARSGAEELYDLIADPNEEHNLIAERREDADRLRAEIDAWLQDCDGRKRGKVIRVKPNRQTAEQLQNLGYTGK